MRGLIFLIRIFLRIEQKLSLMIDIMNMKVAYQPYQPAHSSQWLDNQEVMQILKISASTLKRRRLEGTLPCTRMKGKCYYKDSDIQEVLRKEWGKC